MTVHLILFYKDYSNLKIDISYHFVVDIPAYYSQRPIQNPVEHLRWSFSTKIIND